MLNADAAWLVLQSIQPPWVGAINTGNGFSHCWERNGKFYIAVGPVNQGFQHTGFLGLTLASSKVNGNELPRNGSQGQCVNYNKTVKNRACLSANGIRASRM